MCASARVHSGVCGGLVASVKQVAVLINDTRNATHRSLAKPKWLICKCSVATHYQSGFHTTPQLSLSNPLASTTKQDTCLNVWTRARMTVCFCLFRLFIKLSRQFFQFIYCMPVYRWLTVKPFSAPNSVFYIKIYKNLNFHWSITRTHQKRVTPRHD